MAFWRTTKADIVNHLARRHGYASYLEICTPTTGWRYPKIDRSAFVTCHRLMYRCPATYSDGLGIDFRSETLEIDACLDKIRAHNLRYDVILVDPWHEYETSYRDLEAAAAQLAEGGAIVVHDCLPPKERIASPNFARGDWCGVTFKAYVDFVTTRSGVTYRTVDTDYGCGIIQRISDRDADISDERAQLLRDWRDIGADFGTAFRFLRDNRKALLNLISVGEFKRSEARGDTRPIAIHQAAQ